MNAIEVVGFGAMNMDQIYGVERILTDGEAPVAEFRLSPGGSAANTIYSLAKLGVGTGFIGAVGDDEEGKVLLKDLESMGVDTGQIKVKKAKTGSTLCLTDKRGRRALYVLPGANSLLASEDIDPAYINQATMLHLSSFADEGQLVVQKQLMERMSPSIKVSFAPGSIYAARGLEVMAPIIERTHILFLNRKEAEELTGEDFQKGARKLLEQGCRIVAITLGQGIGKGNTIATCYLIAAQGEYMIQAERAKKEPEADTTGAGDAFAAGFLYGFLRGKGLEECGYLGDLVARLSTTKLGARAGLPSLQELEQRCKQLYKKPL
ncbi:MAG: carbohydrate kinase family protein [Dehalococcoidia bacterium]